MEDLGVSVTVLPPRLSDAEAKQILAVSGSFLSHAPP